LFDKLRSRLFFHLLGSKWHGFFLLPGGYGRPPGLGIEFCKREITLPLSIEDAAELRDVLGDLIIAASDPS
jgi:hypothetical protein